MRTLIAMPAMSMVYTDMMMSMVTLDKPEGSEIMVQKNTLIYDARNRISATAISKGFDRVLWVDSDMIFPHDALTQLSTDMDAGCEFVSALYFSRYAPTFPSVFKEIVYQTDADGNLDSHADLYRDYPQDALFETKGSGSAFVMTTTELLEDVWREFGPPFTPLLRLGEDLSFCWRVAQMGRKMWCDSRVKVGHIGEHIYCEQDYERGH